jgi:hypothetical protein
MVLRPSFTAREHAARCRGALLRAPRSNMRGAPPPRHRGPPRAPGRAGAHQRRLPLGRAVVEQPQRLAGAARARDRLVHQPHQAQVAALCGSAVLVRRPAMTDLQRLRAPRPPAAPRRVRRCDRCRMASWGLRGCSPMPATGRGSSARRRRAPGEPCQRPPRQDKGFARASLHTGRRAQHAAALTTACLGTAPAPRCTGSGAPARTRRAREHGLGITRVVNDGILRLRRAGLLVADGLRQRSAPARGAPCWTR